MKALVISALSTFALLSASSVTSMVEANDDGHDLVKIVCQNTGSKVGLESSGLTKMVEQCGQALAGKMFDSDSPLSDEDAEAIESRCIDEAQEAGEEQFDAMFDRCASREAIAALQGLAQ
ncbi:hypothetical protein [Pleionea litopenaei]|uniref:Secreted protein n=1 Tax=Pleionea litopenaei TaxID=3070815 RepID=A0AA51RX95_9GAMM|nr:hypothetical protein [Pleionea sp. HL-JVS1]WMS89144.1 hypothetical protein Q9312_09595 [Pleionea sp. HL-JVS1]